VKNAVAGIILAAGESIRMGRDKALLPLGDETFLQHLIAVLRDKVSPLIVVLGHHAAEIEQRMLPGAATPGLAAPAGPVFLRNPEYSRGQLSSLQVALRYLMERPAEGALISLVDHPAITKEVVQLLLDRFENTRAQILIPTCRGRRGHPVLFPRRLFQELLDAPLEEGARFVVRRHAAEVELVETEEEGILLDVDRPADYERLLMREQETGNR
jgi:molybdenum cofactor cytidylyltransferase